MRLDAEANSELKSLKLVPIKPFKEISVGDPMYFEDLDAEERIPGTISKKMKKNLENLTLDTKTSCCKQGIVAISEIEEDLGYGDERYSYIIMDVALSCKGTFQAAEKDFLVYLTDRHYVNSVKKEHELGCDGARFEICVDGRFDEVQTGADGFYGYAAELKQYSGFQMSLTFDSDLFSVEDVENLASYWFVKDERPENQAVLEHLDTSIREYLNAGLEQALERD